MDKKPSSVVMARQRFRPPSRSPAQPLPPEDAGPRDVESTARRLRDDAVSGVITGLCLIEMRADGSWAAYTAGQARADPNRTIGLLHRLLQRLASS